MSRLKVLPLDKTVDKDLFKEENINTVATEGVWVSFPSEGSDQFSLCEETDKFKINEASQGYLEDYTTFCQSPVKFWVNSELTFTRGIYRLLSISSPYGTRAINFSTIHERLVVFDLSGILFKVIIRLTQAPYLALAPYEKCTFPPSQETDWNYKSTTIQFTMEKYQLKALQNKFQQNGIEVYFTKLHTKIIPYSTIDTHADNPHFPFKFMFNVLQFFSRYPWLPDLTVSMVEELFKLYNANEKLFLKALASIKLEERFPNIIETIAEWGVNAANIVNFKKVKRIVITPSRVIFQYVQDSPSRALRILGRRFLLYVAFRDENGKEVQEEHPLLFERLKRTVVQGLRIPYVAEHFDFFGSTNSQLKQKAAIFLPDAENKRKLLGDFSKCENPGSVLARIGLSFSTSVATIEINKEHNCVEDMEDVKIDEFIASDGVGTISNNLLDEILAKHLKVSRNILVDGIQIRYKGYKGVLCRKHAAPDNQIELRKTMHKFDSDYSIIDVINYSAARTVRLNRQVILLLSQGPNGIPNHMFFELVINNLTTRLENLEDKEKSRGVLSELLPSLADILQKHPEFDVRVDKFFWSLLQKHFLTQYKLIFKKFNLEVKEGVMLLGVMDEYGDLEANQVYFTWKFPNDPNYHTLPEGTKVLIFRHPAILPEDLQVATYTSKVSENLKKLSNVLVFSRKGDPKPLPVKCGGDLDGDQYAIIWDERFIPKQPRNSSYEFHPVPMQIRDCHSNDPLQNFFINFSQKSNSIGVAATRWLIKADKFGVCHQKALMAGKLVKETLDSVKSGQVYQFSKAPKKYPDYLNKKGKPRYKSNSIIGKLHHFLSNLVQIKQDTEQKAQVDVPYKRPENPTAIDRIYEEYHLKMSALLNLAEIENETEFIVELYRKGREYPTLAESLRQLRADIEARFNHEFKLPEEQQQAIEKAKELINANPGYFKSFLWIFPSLMIASSQGNLLAFPQQVCENFLKGFETESSTAYSRYQKYQNLFATLAEKLRRGYTGTYGRSSTCKIEQFGSSSIGIFLNYSDLDMVCFLDKIDTVENLEGLVKNFCNVESVKTVQAQVPLVTFYHEGTKVEISLNNPIGRRRTVYFLTFFRENPILFPIFYSIYVAYKDFSMHRIKPYQLLLHFLQFSINSGANDPKLDSLEKIDQAALEINEAEIIEQLFAQKASSYSPEQKEKVGRLVLTFFRTLIAREFTSPVYDVIKREYLFDCRDDELGKTLHEKRKAGGTLDEGETKTLRRYLEMKKIKSVYSKLGMYMLQNVHFFLCESTNFININDDSVKRIDLSDAAAKQINKNYRFFQELLQQKLNCPVSFHQSLIIDNEQHKANSFSKDNLKKFQKCCYAKICTTDAAIVREAEHYFSTFKEESGNKRFADGAPTIYVHGADKNSPLKLTPDTDELGRARYFPVASKHSLEGHLKNRLKRKLVKQLQEFCKYRKDHVPGRLRFSLTLGQCRLFVMNDNSIRSIVNLAFTNYKDIQKSLSIEGQDMRLSFPNVVPTEYYKALFNKVSSKYAMEEPKIRYLLNLTRKARGNNKSQDYDIKGYYNEDFSFKKTTIPDMSILSFTIFAPEDSVCGFSQRFQVKYTTDLENHQKLYGGAVPDFTVAKIVESESDGKIQLNDTILKWGSGVKNTKRKIFLQKTKKHKFILPCGNVNFKKLTLQRYYWLVSEKKYKITYEKKRAIIFTLHPPHGDYLANDKLLDEWCSEIITLSQSLYDVSSCSC